MKAKAAGKRKERKCRANTKPAATSDGSLRWPILLDQLAMIEQPHYFAIHQDRFTTPKKLKGKSSFLQMCFLDWLKLSEDKKFYWSDGFWRDLCRNNVKFPLVMPELMKVLWYGSLRRDIQASRAASEELRTLADYIDAVNARKGDRGQRLLVTEVLYAYADRVKAMEQPILSWRELRDEVWPDYSDTAANWQKFLRDRGIPFKPVGQFRGRKCVRKSGNNTHSHH